MGNLKMFPNTPDVTWAPSPARRSADSLWWWSTAGWWLSQDSPGRQREWFSECLRGIFCSSCCSWPWGAQDGEDTRAELAALPSSRREYYL